MSARCAVYRLYAADEALLYVGAAEDLERRWKHHFYTQPWWQEVQRKAVEWHPDRETALAIERAAIKAERPRFNIIHAIEPLPQPEYTPSEPSVYLSTTELADKAGTSRFTVEREIKRGNLTAEKKAGRWLIQDAEADRWIAQYRPYAEQRDRHSDAPAE
jgi:predicted GIY-YIG superfamily endonuclease